MLLKEGEPDIDVAAGRIRVGANLMSQLDQFLSIAAIYPRKRNAKISGDAEPAPLNADQCRQWRLL